MTVAEIRSRIADAALSFGRTGKLSDMEMIRELARLYDERPSAVYKISDHAIKRFCERSGCNSEARARKAIMRMLDQAEPVELLERYKLATYFNHGVKQTLYLKYEQWLFPICNNTVVTVHNAEAKRWRKLEAQ